MANILNIFNTYPKGHDLTILQTLYSRPYKMENGKWAKPAISLIAKDNITGKKVLCEIDNPEYIWFLAKDQKKLTHHYDYLPKSELDPMQCPFAELERHIAQSTGNVKFFNNNLSSGNYRENMKLHTLNQVFFSDQNIEDHYRFWFNRLFKNEIQSVTKAYLDIEVDISNIVGDFPEPGEAPVNAVTYINNGVINTYILRDPNNLLVQEFENQVATGQIEKELRELIDFAIGDEQRQRKFNIYNLKFKVNFFDEEIHLLASLFNQINSEEPDFLMAWNMAFDIPYIIARIRNLGYTPESIMCHPDFNLIRKAEYFIDTKMENQYAERGDYAFISSYTVYLDQMIQFASRRKGQSAFASFKLNDIGAQICGVQKLNYHHITTDLAKLPFLDFKTFIFYNIVDVLVQVCIEESTDDIGYIYNSSVMNNTRFAKVHRQTIYLRNKQIDFYYDMKLIVGNNINKTREKPSEKFDGAFVADPNLINDSVKLRINGIPVFLCDNLVDFDFSSLYPSINREFNLSSPSEIGKIEFEDNKDASSAFIEDMVTKDYLTFGHRWLGLPSYDKLAREIQRLVSSGAIDTKEEFKVYDKGFLVKPPKEEYNELMPALTKYSDDTMYAIYAEKEIPGGM